ncbi:MAG: protein translocase subunit SecD [Candidatus Uhrbacteria bacterium]
MSWFIGRKRMWIGAIAVILLAFVATAYAAPNYWNSLVERPGLSWLAFNGKSLRLGLDLKGGTHLVYEADTSIIPDRDQRTAMEGVRDVIERRVNALGVAEPMVQITRVEGHWRLVVELAGVYDTQKAIEAIGATPVLEFKEQNTDPEPKLTPEQEQQLRVDNATARRRAESILRDAQKPGADFSALARQYSEDDGSREQGGDLGWFRRGAMVKEFEAAVFDQLRVDEITSQVVETQFGWHIIRKTGERDVEAATPASVQAVTESGKPIEVRVEDDLKSQVSILNPEKEARASHILVKKKTATDILPKHDPWKYTGLGGKQLKSATLQFDPTTTEAEVGLEFNSEGAKLFEEVTKRNVNKPIAITIDGRSPMDTDGDGAITESDIYAPVVQDVITGGKARITGSLTVDTAKQLSRRLQAGALPVPITLLSETTVGATLGEESVAASLRAGLIGFLLVALFMILYYRLPGVIATVALAAYVAFVISVMKILGATFTLAGIAGFVMSIGMAVDANVLILERLKEEIRNGRSLFDATAVAFRRAWTSIRDSNITTLITCATLASFSSGVVKGFAVTLGIGVLVSMFSAITVSRVLLGLVAGWIERPWWYGVSRSRQLAPTSRASGPTTSPGRTCPDRTCPDRSVGGVGGVGINSR